MIKRESKFIDETTKKVDILVSGNVAANTDDELEDEAPFDDADETLLLEKGAKLTTKAKAKSADGLTFAVINKRYELLGLAGQGGMASVYKARDLKDNKEVAVKVLDRDLANMDSVLERFQKEVSAASAMAHENLAAVYDSGVTEDGRPYIVMEYMRGQTLAQLLKKRAKLSLNEFADIFVQVAKGLAHAHRRGVVHRDIKPSNIFLYTDEKEKLGVKLLDFGIAKSLADIDETSLNITHTGQVIGSPFYMSPEQCRALPVDTRSDIYSLGCVMFEAITGGVPFKGETALDTLYKHIHEPAPRIKSNAQKLRAAEILANTIETALMKLPEARYHTARELGKDLAKLTNWDDLPSDLDFDVEPRKTEPVKERSRFSATGIAITTIIALSMLVCGSLLSNNIHGPSANTPELASTSDTKLLLKELWMLSEKALEDQHYDEAVKYAQRADNGTYRFPNTLQNAVSKLKLALALFQQESMNPMADDTRHSQNMQRVEENLRNSLKIFDEYLDGKGAKLPEQIIQLLSESEIPDLNRYYFEANGQLANLLADDYQYRSDEAKKLYEKVEKLFENRTETTNYSEQEAKQFLNSLANLYFADKEYLKSARIFAMIAETWNERLVDKANSSSDASFKGVWISPYKKTDSNLHLNLNQDGESLTGTITLAPLPSRAIWKGNLTGVCMSNTSSGSFSISGIASDDSSGVNSKVKSIQGDINITRYKNFLVVRMSNYNGDVNIALPWVEVLQLKPDKHSAKKKS